MTLLLAELDRVDTQLQEWAPGDLQSIQEILAARQYVLDRLVPRLADSAFDQLLHPGLPAFLGRYREALLRQRRILLKNRCLQLAYEHGGCICQIYQPRELLHLR